jgi:hypothetical protein
MEYVDHITELLNTNMWDADPTSLRGSAKDLICTISEVIEASERLTEVVARPFEFSRDAMAEAYAEVNAALAEMSDRFDLMVEAV